MQKINKLVISFLITLLLCASLASCLGGQITPTGLKIDNTPFEIATKQSSTSIVTTEESTATPLEFVPNVNDTPQAVWMGEITLYTNLNIDREKDFSIENLVKSDNTQAFFDFDKNEILDSENADIYFFVDCGTDCFNSIFSINNAKSARIGEKEPKLQGCLEALQEKNNIITSPIPGNYSCIKTNSGNIVQILPLRNEAKYRNAKLVFQYTIWYQGQ